MLQNSLKRENIFITGLAGFIAFHMAEYYLKKGFYVFGVDNFLSGQRENIEVLKKNYPLQFNFQEVDILNRENLFKYANNHNISLIYHLACPASPPIYQKNPLNTLDVCYVGTKNILDLAKEHRARILLASTSEIYGDPLEHPQPESYRGNVNTMGIRSCYDEGKRILETLGFVYALDGLEVRTARIFNTYGPRMHPLDGRVLTNFITQALRGDPLTIYGDGTQTRSLCYCTDLIEGLVKLAESNETRAINLGSEFEFKIIDVAHLVIEKINQDLKIVHRPFPQDDPKMRRPQIALAKTTIDWEPKISLSEGLDRMIQFYKETLK